MPSPQFSPAGGIGSTYSDPTTGDKYVYASSGWKIATRGNDPLLKKYTPSTSGSNPDAGKQYGGWYDNPATGRNQRWFNGIWTDGEEPGQQTQQQVDPADDYINKILDSVTAPLKQAQSRAEQFDRENPFAFDEVLARQSSEERFDPYYNAELGDFLLGVERSRSRSVQDEQKLRKELLISADTQSGDLKDTLDRTIRASEQGFAGAGIFFSGERAATSGESTVDTNKNIAQIERNRDLSTQDSQTREARNLEDLALKQSTVERQTKAARETDILSDVETQRQEELRKRELARENFVGIPGYAGSSSLSVLGL